MEFKSKIISLNKQIITAFAVIMTLTIIAIAIFVNKSFEAEFSKYVDDSNKAEVNHLVFDLRNVYNDNEWDIEIIKLLGEDAISKGVALEIYDDNNNLIWSVFKDEQMLSNQTLNNIKSNMKRIDQSWNGQLREYKFDIYDDNKKIIGYEKIIHYDSIYYMENDMEFLSIMNRFMLIISIISIGATIIISILISKSISNPIEKVSSMAKVIGEGNYKNTLEYNSNIKEVNELIMSINKLGEELNKQELLRKRLTTDIAHELRTPITSIQGHLDAMIDGVWEITPQRLISIKEEVSRLGSLIGSLRNLAKFDNETSELDIKNTNLGEMIQNIIYNYETKALDKNININYKLNNVYMDIDKNQFSQVIVNLLSNAIKYTNRGGEIFIEIYENNNIIAISIKDTGIGIPKEDLNYIFERFYRVDKSRNKETGGIGVGLTIAKAIVTSHNGDIIVNSNINEGTEFLIKFNK